MHKNDGDIILKKERPHKEKKNFRELNSSRKLKQKLQIITAKCKKYIHYLFNMTYCRIRINFIVTFREIGLICNIKLRTDRAAEKKLLVSPVTTLLDP